MVQQTEFEDNTSQAGGAVDIDVTATSDEQFENEVRSMTYCYYNKPLVKYIICSLKIELTGVSETGPSMVQKENILV